MTARVDPRVTGLGPLPDGGTVAIIGGGPGGTAAALALQRGARALGRRVRIILVEAKQFDGPGHYNQCAGVLSPPIETLVEQELEAAFPRHLTRSAITGYVLHSAGRQITLDGPGAPSLALRRIQFDHYMLNAVRERGVEVLAARLGEVEFHADRVVIYTDQAPVDAHVVVGAFGLDEGTAASFARTTAYRPPPAMSAMVTKYHPGEAAMAAFGCRIHAFLPAAAPIEFGAVTPKGNHLTVNIAGARLTSGDLDRFLALPEVRAVLPNLDRAGQHDSNDLRYFRGRFPCGLARGFTGDRYVCVGDAAGLVRAFKGKGVTSAIQTAIRAAHVILHVGISAQAFEAFHAANRDLTGDLPYGQAMRRVTVLATRLRLMSTVLRAAETAPGLRQALFDAVSAHRAYRSVLADALAPRSVARIAAALLRRG